MIQKALEYLGEKFVRADAGSIVSAPPCEHKSHYFVREVDGTLAERIAVPPPQDDRIYSLDDFLVAMPDEATKIYVSEDAIYAVTAGHDRCTMPLNNTAQFSHLLRQPVMFDQKGFARLLSVDLAECVDEETVRIFRNLKVKSESDGETKISQGRESVSRSIRREAQGETGAFPERIHLQIPLYANVDDAEGGLLWQSVACAVSADFRDNDIFFSLSPLAGEITMAIKNTVQLIRDRLAPSNVPIVAGKPTPSLV
jgi:hypothetical protein